MAKSNARQSLALTEMDYAILDALTADPFASARAVADKLGVPPAMVTARIRVMDRRQVSHLLAVLDFSAAGQQTCFVLLEVRGRPIEVVVAEIEPITEVLLISTLVGGGHDLLLMVRFATIGSLHKILANKVGRIEGIRRYEVSIVLDVPLFRPRYSRLSAKPECPTDVAETMDYLAREFPEDQLDELDRHIVAELLLNARQSINSIARKYDINASTVRYRVRGLENRGLIRFMTVLDSPALGIQAYALIEIEPEASRLAHVLARLRETSLLSQIFVTTGEAPIKGIIEGEDLHAIRRIKSDLLAQIDGINGVTVSAILGAHKYDVRWGYKIT